MGSHLVEYLFQQNEISKGIFRKGAHLKIMDLNGVQGVEADLLDRHSLHEAMEGVDTVYNLASPMPGRDRDFARVNTEGLSNLLEVAKESEAKSFVHLSTLEVYGFGDPMIVPESEPKPGDEYQSSKLLAERTLLEYAKRSPSPKITILRAARAFGSRDTSFVVPLLRMVEAGSVVLPPSGSMSFSHPKDIAEAMYLAASKPSLGKNLFLIKSFDTEPATLAVSLSKAVGETPSVKTEGPFTKSRLPPYTRAQLRAHLRLDSDEGWSELGYSPKFDLTAACDEIANWYKREPWATEQD